MGAVRIMDAGGAVLVSIFVRQHRRQERGLASFDAFPKRKGSCPGCSSYHLGRAGLDRIRSPGQHRRPHFFEMTIKSLVGLLAELGLGR
jgi:hypothetical protein